MKRVAKLQNASRIAAVAVAVTVLSVAPLAAQPAPPAERCRPASKIEYNSAKAQYLLTSRFGYYMRTGHPWRRYYWYCRF